MERTLLLVDDEADIAAALARLLRPYGYNILRAGSGQEGLELLKTHEVGVVVSDQRMPEMTGVEFLSRVKELYPKTVRIVLSGYADLSSVTDAINRGAIYKFLTKPWDNETLCANILEAFRHYELILEKERLMLEIQAANDALAQVNLDLAAAVDHQNSQIEYVVHYDQLTRLPNRLLFLDRLGQELARAQRDGHMLAVMLIDLDRFKQVNDSFGYPVGDQLLQAVAERLASHARAGDTVARIGGDVFGFLLTHIKAAHDAGDIAQKILDSLSRDPVSMMDHEVFASVSIGIGIYPGDGVAAAMLIKNADAALHHAKREMRNTFQYYTGQMNASAWQHLTLETELRRAVEREEFTLYYQPKVSLSTGGIVGVEALLRWQSPSRGLVQPDEFIPLLEETGLIVPAGEWVLRSACKQAHAWQRSGLAGLQMAVNLSALQFRQPDLADVFLGILREHDLDPSWGVLEMELTERLLMRNVEVTLVTLNRLHEMGVRFSIDDFGTGYSSLSYLKRFPISSLKIDQSFVNDLSTNPDDAAIVGAIIALGHNLGMTVIAEGVETPEQLDYLRSMKCDEMQGYLFSRPLPAAEMTRLLQDGKVMNLHMEA